MIAQQNKGCSSESLKSQHLLGPKFPKPWAEARGNWKGPKGLSQREAEVGEWNQLKQSQTHGHVQPEPTRATGPSLGFGAQAQFDLLKLNVRFSLDLQSNLLMLLCKGCFL